MALHLLIPHRAKRRDDHDPVHVIRNHRAIRGGIRPAKDRVEDPPAATAVEFRVAVVDVPDRGADVVGARAGAYLGGVAADDVVPVLLLEVPDGFAEEARGDEVEEAGGDYEEDLEFGGGAAPVAFVSMKFISR